MRSASSLLDSREPRESYWWSLPETQSAIYRHKWYSRLEASKRHQVQETHTRMEALPGQRTVSHRFCTTPAPVESPSWTSVPYGAPSASPMSAVTAKREAAMARRSRRRGSDAGFAVVQTLVVLAIAGIVAAMAIPVYAARAKESVLRQNAATLELEVKSYLAAGLDDRDGEANASAVIAHALCGPGAGISAWYVNPLCGSRAVVCQTALPAGTGSVPPAVWITDDQGYAFGEFTASTTTKSRLRGTLMIVSIVHDGRTSGVEVFYVDAAGHRSPTSTTIAI